MGWWKRALVVVCAALSFGCGNGPSEESRPADVAPTSSAAPVTSSFAPPALGSAALEAQLDELGLASVDAELQPAGGKTFQGPAPKPIEESATPIDASTPESLLQGTLDALARGDVAALARLRRPRRTFPTLNEDDGADAERRFLSQAMAPTWERIGRAFAAGEYEIQARSEREAVIVLRVGGALGQYRIPLKKDGDSWFMS